MDNVVQWLRTRNEIEYRTWWEEQARSRRKDTALFARYVSPAKDYPAAGAREGYSRPKARRRGRARAFTRGDARRRGRPDARPIPTDDPPSFRDFYAQYELRLSELHPFQESADLAAFARITNEALSGASPFARDIARCMGKSGSPRFTALFVWWPPEEHVTANARGDILLQNTIRSGTAGRGARDGRRHARRLTHVVSSPAARARAQELSSVFSGAATDRLKPLPGAGGAASPSSCQRNDICATTPRARLDPEPGTATRGYRTTQAPLSRVRRASHRRRDVRRRARRRCARSFASKARRIISAISNRPPCRREPASTRDGPGGVQFDSASASSPARRRAGGADDRVRSLSRESAPGCSSRRRAPGLLLSREVIGGAGGAPGVVIPPPVS